MRNILIISIYWLKKNFHHKMTKAIFNCYDIIITILHRIIMHIFINILIYSTAKISSASHAISSLTYAIAVPIPKLDFIFVISVTNVNVSPGITFRLNLALLIPPK